jgi:hypothetical protein
LINIADRKLKLLFFEICNRHSRILDQDKHIYIKHYGEFDSGEFEEYFFEYYEKAKRNGLPTYAEKEKLLISENYWTEEQEKELKYKQEKLEKLEKIHGGLFLKSHIDKSKKEINELKKDVKLLSDDKRELMGMYAESYAQNKVDFIYILNSFYKDKDLKEKLLDIENYDVDENLYYKYIILHNKAIEKFNIDNIKKISLSDFFQNMINAADANCYYLFNKPVYNLSYYQSSIYSYGKFFHTVLGLPEARKLDSNTRKDADKLIEWYNAFVNFKNKNPNASGKGMNFVMGANKEDMEYLKQEVKNDVNDMAKAKGGTLGIADLAKLSKI